MSNQQSTVPSGFRQIPGYPRYAINEHGTVISICRCGAGTNSTWTDAKQLTPMTNSSGYHRVALSRDGKRRKIRVHKLVLITFVGPCLDGMQCRHIDGNPANNHVSNLVWGTPVENANDKIEHGTDNRGERHSRVKLNDSDVLEIRRRAANGELPWVIANDFPVTRQCISQIVRRKKWKHI